MQKDEKTTKFIDRAKSVHGDTYIYSNAIYQTCKTKIEVMCPSHGSFFVTPNNHVTNKSGCPKCQVSKRQQIVQSRESHTFVEECNKIHKCKYDYVKTVYTNAHAHVTITCPTHGDFGMVAYTHKQGGNCPRCARDVIAKHNALTQQEFVDRANTVHNGTYVYDYVEYHNMKTKVQIVCPVHGPFFQRPGSHIRGEGCPTCGRKSWFAEQGGYSQRMFDVNPHMKTEPGILYVVEFFSTTERFYKIGLTKRSIKDRFHWGYNDYTMRIISEHSTTLYKAWVVEQSILDLMKSNRYFPSIKIGGFTECMSEHIDIAYLCTHISTLITHPTI